MTLLLTNNLPLLADAPNGIRKLRDLILELAVRGRLLPQNSSDESASELLKRIAEEKALLVAEGKIRKPKPLAEITEEEKPFEIPSSWRWVRLAKGVIKLTDGEHLSPPKSSSGMPLLTAKDVTDSGVLLENTQFVNYENGLKYRERCNPNRGDILICSRGTIGRCAAVETDQIFCLMGSVILVKPSANTFYRYVFRYLQTTLAQQWMRGASSATAVSALYLKDVANCLLPLPPLDEQYRIVAKVDELMALCDHLEAQQAHAESAHKQLVQALLDSLTEASDATEFAASWQRLAEHFHTLFNTESSIDALKQTLLQMAVMGKLVSQHPSDEPACELLKRITEEKVQLVGEGKIKKQKSLAEIAEEEKPYVLPTSWVWGRLGELTLKITDGTHHSPTNTPSGDYKYISAKNIKSWGIDLTEITYVTNEVHQEIFSRCDPNKGDILYIKDGATTGITTINSLDEPFSMLSSVALLKPSIGLHNEYLLRAMTSPFFYREMRAGMTGVAITRVTLAKLNNAIIPLPPLAEQHRIVAKIDELMTLCDRLKICLTQARLLNEQLASTLIEQAVA
ncbi:restriction endonuclease subunit S [Pseudomonas sp. N-137]|uniref:restriction endonuclease subunit S n=1 Tax=Pseudomonas sp. N-137 TaxID=3108452 RepID=UPI002ADEAF33|nr:restriction endonuclease subunit S [Pseudomonas sp. N-137]MEA1030707.1 restriction endonuclease subunit S [Pseudomonas sp. N-137]